MSSSLVLSLEFTRLFMYKFSLICCCRIVFSCGFSTIICSNSLSGAMYRSTIQFEKWVRRKRLLGSQNSTGFSAIRLLLHSDTHRWAVFVENHLLLPDDLITILGKFQLLSQKPLQLKQEHEPDPNARFDGNDLARVCRMPESQQKTEKKQLHLCCSVMWFTLTAVTEFGDYSWSKVLLKFLYMVTVSKNCR